MALEVSWFSMALTHRVVLWESAESLCSLALFPTHENPSHWVWAWSHSGSDDHLREDLCAAYLRWCEAHIQMARSVIMGSIVSRRARGDAEERLKEWSPSLRNICSVTKPERSKGQLRLCSENKCQWLWGWIRLRVMWFCPAFGIPLGLLWL